MIKLKKLILLTTVISTYLGCFCIGFPSKEEIHTITGTSPIPLPEIWTFENCIEWAIANNVDVRRNMLAVLESDQNIGLAKDGWLPNVGFSMNHSYTNFPNPVERQIQNSYGSGYNINVSWTIWEGNVRNYRIKTSELLKQQQILYGDDVIKNIELGILQAYLNIMYSAEAVEIAKKTLEVSSAQAQRAKRLMENGKTSMVDYTQMESQMAQDSYYLVQAQSNFSTAKMTLKSLLNLNLEYDLVVDSLDFPDEIIMETLPDMKTVYDIAASWLPQIKSNDLNKDIFDYEIKIAKATALPNISLNGGIGTGYNSGGRNWGYQMGHGLNENIGLNFSVPIYDANVTRRAINMAKLQALEYELTNTQLMNELSQTIESLFIECENARAKYKTGLVQLEATQQTANLVDRQFELGLVNPLDLLTAHNNLLNARLELLQSKFMAILSNKTINYYVSSSVSLP